MQHVYHRAPIIAPAAQGYRHPYKIGGCGCLGEAAPQIAPDPPTSNRNLYIGLSIGAVALAAIFGLKFMQDMKK